ncbi:hypothetical protein Q5752_003886 [Cryptotrichosporon argae]
MPPAPFQTYPTLSFALPSRPYILSLARSPTHLLLTHPGPSLTLADPSTLAAVDELAGGHTGLVSAVCVDDDAVWSAARDGSVVRWDARTCRPAGVVKAFVRKPLPVTALAVAQRDNLVVAGTELVSAEAHIMFWDPRNTKAAVYQHSSTHSDDITHLSFLPPTASYIGPARAHPARLLLSASTDGLVALSDPYEADEEEAVGAADNWGQSIADAGFFAHRGKGRVWARSDMDEVATWSVGAGDDGLELQDAATFPSENFKFRSFTPPSLGAHVVQPAADAQASQPTQLRSDYLVCVAPSLGVSVAGVPMTAVGTNSGAVVLQHSAAEPSAFLLPGEAGHADVVRALYHDVRNEVIYTGSEDGVLCGWSVAGIRLLVGDRQVDDDGGDGREDVPSDDEDDEESEIETDSEGGDDDDDDVDMDAAERRRPGPVLGGGVDRAGKKDRRKGARYDPY